jgi:hypothetical protein
VISAQSFTASFSLLSSAARRAGKAPSPYGGGFFGRCALCAAALAASALVTAAVLPGALLRLV